MYRKLLIGGVCCGVAIACFLHWQPHIGSEGSSLETDIAAVARLTSEQASLDEFADFFRKVAQEKGGEYAFSLMMQVEFPFGLDTHLLGHEVGEELYQQEGIDGMAICTHDFRNACSHTMVIGALIDYGEEAFPRIREACHAAPGGKGAYTMCFHGLGHGVLAFNGYDMERTIAMCDRLGTEEYHEQEAVECFGGAIMEIIGGGGHDAQLWEEKRAEYLQPQSPVALCEMPFVTSKYQPMCYNYMTPYMYESLGADMAQPSPAVIKSAFRFCEEIPMANQASRQSCFAGHGKEFIGLVIGRNFQSEEGYTIENLAIMRQLCALTDAPDGYQSCIHSVADSLYWGAENSYRPALNFCLLQEAKPEADECILYLSTLVKEYVDDPGYYVSFCSAVPEEIHSECRNKLGV